MVKKFSDRKPGTQLVVFVVSKVGMRDAYKVLAFIVQWGMVARKLQREPTWPEYCAYWKESRATYFRAVQVYRRVWPGDKNPQRVWSWVEQRVPLDVTVRQAVDRVAVMKVAA
jgi:hypothetical protein